MGTQVIVPFRDEDDKRHLKLTGDLGQVVPMVSGYSGLYGSLTVPLYFAGMGYSECGADKTVCKTF
jgi:hypothetical protein